MSTKKALLWMAIWAGLAFLFNAGIYLFIGQQKAIEFFGGYIIEQSLSVDNLFLFLLIFSNFGIRPTSQRKVLTLGIFGAIILMLIFVLLGVTIVNRFNWVLYIFGVILIVSGVQMFNKQEPSRNFNKNKFIKFLGRIIPFTDKLEGEKFFIRKNKILYATPLFAILLLIEVSDIVFAIDSVPAIFSITTDPFIVYTSNIFAILGLRNMYFLLEKLHKSFSLVKYGVAMVLVFTGIKLSILFFNIEISLILSLLIILAIMLLSILASLMFKRRGPFKL